MAERLIDLNEVASRFSMSRRWVQGEIEAGRFPRPSIPAKSGSGKNLWREAVIDDEIRRRCNDVEPQNAA
jgi:predicted DNA-binding transcriptional regulator AlpA